MSARLDELFAEAERLYLDASLSASSLRFATRASRLGFSRRFEKLLRELEELYLEELMKSHDAVEGITAFLEKREPSWSNR